MTGFDAAAIDARTADDLRHTASLKWSSTRDGHLAAGLAEMDFGTASSIQRALHSAIDRELHGYLPPSIRRDLLESCSRWQEDPYGWAVPASQIMPIADVTTALQHTITLFTDPGCTVIVPTPAYGPSLSIPTRLGRHVIEVPLMQVACGRLELDVDGIDAAFHSGATLLVLCNPHNPTGTVFTERELRAVGAVVARHGGRVFSDEIYGPLVYEGRRHLPYASLSDASGSHTITAVGTSKAWNTSGLKCAQVIVGNPTDQGLWQHQHARAPYGASTLGAVAATAAYDQGTPWLNGAVAYLGRNRSVVANFFNLNFPEADYVSPEGGYLAWIDFRRLGLRSNPVDVIRDRAGVVLTDGAAFGVLGQGWARLNFALPLPVLSEVLDRINLALSVATNKSSCHLSTQKATS